MRWLSVLAAMVVGLGSGCGSDDSSESGATDTMATDTQGSGGTVDTADTSGTVDSASDTLESTVSTVTSGDPSITETSPSTVTSTTFGSTSWGSSGGSSGQLPFDCFDGDLPVRIDGAGSYSTIQGGVSSAVAGAVIFVCPGVYLEHIVLERDVWLIGAGSGDVVIDGGGVGTALSATNLDIYLEGMTIQNADTGVRSIWDDGAGGSLEMYDVALVANKSIGVWAQGDSANISAYQVNLAAVSVLGTQGPNSSGALLRELSATFIDCVFEDNVSDTGAALMLPGVEATMIGGRVHRNSSGAYGAARLVTVEEVTSQLTIMNADWATGEALDNSPTDITCDDTHVVAGFLGPNSTYVCAANQNPCCG